MQDLSGYPLLRALFPAAVALTGLVLAQDSSPGTDVEAVVSARTKGDPVLTEQMTVPLLGMALNVLPQVLEDVLLQRACRAQVLADLRVDLVPGASDLSPEILPERAEKIAEILRAIAARRLLGIQRNIVGITPEIVPA
jgi:hypothetical protein